MDLNPYQSPVSDEQPVRRDLNLLVTSRILEAMSKTRPHVVFVAVISLLGAAMSVVVAVFSLHETGMFLTMAVWLVFAGLYVGMGVLLWRYGAAINKLLHGGNVPELEEAVELQARFWHLVGVVTMAGFVLGLLAFGLAVALEV